ncbi:interleukin-25-like [Lepisosteus oculatus]|uniref:interleukin-25-like n=1 Tax=Lepisosteus oculatus TaxID=7918 RepID=UPI003722C61B
MDNCTVSHINSGLRTAWAELPSGNIHNRSLAPWEYRVDIDMNRYPHHIFMAHCLHKHCLGPIHKGNTNRYSNVVGISYFMTVYYRHPCEHSDFVRLSSAALEVTTGCTCVSSQ